MYCQYGSYCGQSWQELAFQKTEGNNCHRNQPLFQLSEFIAFSFAGKIRQLLYVHVTLRRIRATIVAVEKQQVLHNLSVCLQPQVSSMKCARAILSSEACLALLYISTLSHKWPNFRGEKVTEHKKCVLIFSTTFSETVLILRKTGLNMI